MSSVASRELRNHTRAVLDRVEAGEVVTITVDGRAVAELRPLASRPQWMTRERFLANLVQADAGLAADLHELAPDTTDDVEPW